MNLIEYLDAANASMTRGVELANQRTSGLDAMADAESRYADAVKTSTDAVLKSRTVLAGTPQPTPDSVIVGYDPEGRPIWYTPPKFVPIGTGAGSGGATAGGSPGAGAAPAAAAPPGFNPAAGLGSPADASFWAPPTPDSVQIGIGADGKPRWYTPPHFAPVGEGGQQAGGSGAASDSAAAGIPLEVAHDASAGLGAPGDASFWKKPTPDAVQIGTKPNGQPIWHIPPHFAAIGENRPGEGVYNYGPGGPAVPPKHFPGEFNPHLPVGEPGNDPRFPLIPSAPSVTTGSFGTGSTTKSTAAPSVYAPTKPTPGETQIVKQLQRVVDALGQIRSDAKSGDARLDMRRQGLG